MTPTTWLYLRASGRALVRNPSDAAASNLRLEIARAAAEGATVQQISDAALLPVATVLRYSAKEVSK